MGMLKNPKHELFARNRAEGMSGVDAYLEAGFRAARKSAEVLASRLGKVKNVRERIAELVDQAVDVWVERTALTEEMVISGVMRCARMYSDPNHKAFTPASGMRAYELLGKRLAMWVDRVEDRGKRPSDINTVAEADAALAQSNADIEKLMVQRRELSGNGSSKPTRGNGKLVH